MKARPHYQQSKVTRQDLYIAEHVVIKSKPVFKQCLNNFHCRKSLLNF